MNKSPLPPGSESHSPPTKGANEPGLDEKADFDDYSVYYQGHLNDYVLMKEAKKRPQECAIGLDDKADFDDYTVYYDGHLNEYGLVKDALVTQSAGTNQPRPPAPQDTAGLRSRLANEERARIADKESPYAFPELQIDDTVYEKCLSKGKFIELPEKKPRTRLSPRSGREQQRVRTRIRRKIPRNPKTLNSSCANAEQFETMSGSDFEEESETESTNPSNEHGKVSPETKCRGPSEREMTRLPQNIKPARLDEAADFDEYTIYDQGALNEYGLMKDVQNITRGGEVGAGLDVHANFDDYTIYDEGELNEYGLLKDMRNIKRDGGTGVDQHADFDEYTVVDEGELNEYGLMKDLLMKPKDCAIGEDEAANIEDYTAYLEMTTDMQNQKQDGATMNTTWGGSRKP